VILQQFHTDNGIFTSKEFMEDLMDSEQSVRFSGVGAAHQNGSAERNIQTIANMARTMMLHAALRSPSGFITADLWPMAMDHAAWLYNRIPSLETGLAPIKVWSHSTQ
jgi:transposase InsO family protein